MRFDFVCDIEKLVLVLSFEPSEVFPANTLGYYGKENYNSLILAAQALDSFCCINREVTNGANAMYVNVSIAVCLVHVRQLPYHLQNRIRGFLQ